jgi:diguanylate cyclase (GGDEF)-like protein/PAS domain S-box-containing protein
MKTLRHRRVVWLIALLAVASIASISVVSARRYVAAHAAVHHTMAVRAEISETLSLLQDAETAQRGFILTGDAEFLTPHTHAKQAIDAQFAELRALTRDDKPQNSSARTLQRLASEKLAELDETIALRRSDMTDQALAIVRSGRGRRIMEAFRAETERMLTREAARLTSREAAVARGETQTALTLCIALSIVLFVIATTLATVGHDVREAQNIADRLQQSERAFRALADNASDLVRILDVDGRLLYVSPSSKALLGYEPDEMRALTRETLLHVDERELATRAAERVRTGETTFEVLLHRMRSKNGVDHWFETRVQLAIDQPPGGGHLHLTSRDFTARKLAEDALRTQTTQLQSILSSMGDGVVVFDENRQLLVVNPAAREYIRQDVGERVAEQWSQQHQTYLPDGSAYFPSEEGPLTRALRGEASVGVELIIHDRAGRARTFSITAHPIRDGERAAGCVAVYRDVTEQRRSEKDVQESEQRWRILSEASFEGVAITQAALVLDTNETFAAWVGRDAAELIGIDGISLFAPADRDFVRTMSTQRAALYEAHLLRKDGSAFSVEVRGREARFRGQPVRIAVVRDITERKAREAELRQQAELLRALSLRDELSGLFNRRGFLEHASQQLRGVARARRKACLFFADLNGLKVINDGFGHEAGDRAIVAAGRLLSEVFRESDIVARLGGDEFAVFAPECGEEDVPSVRARLQSAIETLNVTSNEPYRLSMSLGVAVYDPQSALELDRLMEVADANMYEDKRSGPRARSAQGAMRG